MNEPSTVSVYSFRVLDGLLRRMEVQLYKATRERIVELGGEVLESTEERVPLDQIDLLGCYSRSISVWAALE